MKIQHMRIALSAFIVSGIAHTALAGTIDPTADNFQWFTDAFSAINGTLDLLVPLLISLAVILFMWGMVVFMANTDNEQARTSGKTKMIWGVVILFVMLSVWGFVEILDTIFNLDRTTVPDGPNVTF